MLKADADERDQYSRRTSLRLNGIQKTDRETAEKCREKVIDVIKKLKLPISEDSVDRAHRVGVPAKVKGNDRPQKVIVKFTSFRSRANFYKSRKEVKDKKYFCISLIIKIKYVAIENRRFRRLEDL